MIKATEKTYREVYVEQFGADGDMSLLYTPTLGDYFRLRRGEISILLSFRDVDEICAAFRVLRERVKG